MSTDVYVILKYSDFTFKFILNLFFWLEHSFLWAMKTLFNHDFLFQGFIVLVKNKIKNYTASVSGKV